jgi:hypothetical protein
MIPVSNFHLEEMSRHPVKRLPAAEKILHLAYVGYGMYYLQWRTKEFFVVLSSTNSVEDRGKREWGSGGGNPLAGGSAHFSNE